MCYLEMLLRPFDRLRVQSNTFSFIYANFLMKNCLPPAHFRDNCAEKHPFLRVQHTFILQIIMKIVHFCCRIKKLSVALHLSNK